MSSPPTDLLEFLDREVLPRLFTGLDAAFPEFGWKPTPRGWVATHAVYTRKAFGARPDRVVCRMPAGFYIHGAGAQSWVSFVAGDSDPRGRVFVDAVRDLARRVGAGELPEVAPEAAEARRARWEERERKARLLGGLWEHAYHALRNGTGALGRAYLETVRGLSAAEISRAALGWIPEDPGALSAWARELDLEEPTLAELGLVRTGAAATRYGTSAWSGRVVGVVRDLSGRVVNLWGRAVRDGVEPRYLYLRGCERRSVGAIGLFEAAVQSKAGREDLVLVEGVFDVATLAARGLPGIAALGGSAREVDEAAIRRLIEARVSTVTLALDADEEGGLGFDQLVERWGRVPAAPRLFAVDPSAYDGAKDPDEFVRRDGLPALLDRVRSAELAIDVWLRRRLPPSPTAAPTPAAKVLLAEAERLLALASVWVAPPVAVVRHRLRAAAARLLDVPSDTFEEVSPCAS